MLGSTSHTHPYYIFNNCHHQIQHTYCTTQFCPCFKGFHIHIIRIQNRAAIAVSGIFHASRQTNSGRMWSVVLVLRKELRWQEEERHKTKWFSVAVDLAPQWSELPTSFWWPGGSLRGYIWNVNEWNILIYSKARQWKDFSCFLNILNTFLGKSNIFNNLLQPV